MISVSPQLRARLARLRTARSLDTNIVGVDASARSTNIWSSLSAYAKRLAEIRVRARQYLFASKSSNKDVEVNRNNLHILGADIDSLLAKNNQLTATKPVSVQAKPKKGAAPLIASNQAQPASTKPRPATWIGNPTTELQVLRSYVTEGKNKGKIAVQTDANQIFYYAAGTPDAQIKKELSDTKSILAQNANYKMGQGRATKETLSTGGDVTWRTNYRGYIQARFSDGKVNEYASLADMRSGVVLAQRQQIKLAEVKKAKTKKPPSQIAGKLKTQSGSQQTNPALVTQNSTQASQNALGKTTPVAGAQSSASSKSYEAVSWDQLIMILVNRPLSGTGEVLADLGMSKLPGGKKTSELVNFLKQINRINKNSKDGNTAAGSGADPVRYEHTASVRSQKSVGQIKVDAFVILDLPDPLYKKFLSTFLPGNSAAAKRGRDFLNGLRLKLRKMSKNKTKMAGFLRGVDLRFTLGQTAWAFDPFWIGTPKNVKGFLIAPWASPRPMFGYDGKFQGYKLWAGVTFITPFHGPFKIGGSASPAICLTWNGEGLANSNVKRNKAGNIGLVVKFGGEDRFITWPGFSEMIENSGMGSLKDVGTTTARATSLESFAGDALNAFDPVMLEKLKLTKDSAEKIANGSATLMEVGAAVTGISSGAFLASQLAKNTSKLANTKYPNSKFTRNIVNSKPANAAGKVIEFFEHPIQSTRSAWPQIVSKIPAPIARIGTEIVKITTPVVRAVAPHLAQMVRGWAVLVEGGTTIVTRVGAAIVGGLSWPLIALAAAIALALTASEKRKAGATTLSDMALDRISGSAIKINDILAKNKIVSTEDRIIIQKELDLMRSTSEKWSTDPQFISVVKKLPKKERIVLSIDYTNAVEAEVRKRF